jgi:hypothetical protein
MDRHSVCHSSSHQIHGAHHRARHAYAVAFGHDAILNVSFEANWQYIKERKQRLIVQNNKRVNATCIPHQYNVGNRVMVRLDPNRKHRTDQFKGPFTVTRVYDNGSVLVLSSSLGPPLLVELSRRHGTSETWICVWTDHPYQSRMQASLALYYPNLMSHACWRTLPV